MSKIQSPVNPVEATVNETATAHVSPPDVGPWTSDFGRFDSAADIGSGILRFGLNANGVCKSFTSPDGKLIEVLRGVSFAVAAGEVVAITGASGAGKSTLLHLLGGLEAADEGSIALGEIDITQLSPAALARWRNEAIGFVFQFHHLLPDLTAAENVAMPLLINRTTKSESMTHAVQVLESMGLRDRADHPVRHLSGGEQQRVAVARALIKQPRLVLADEPTGNLDAGTGNEIAEVLLAYARARQAMVVIATHNERLAGRCDHTLFLSHGKLACATIDVH